MVKNRSVIHKEYFNNIDEVVQPPLEQQIIVDGLVQSLAKLLAWDSGRNTFRFLSTDVDGKLLVSTEPTKSNTAINSQITVTTTSQVALANQPLRRGFTLQNVGSVNVYFELDDTAVAATGLLLPPGTSWTDEVYVGAVAVITPSGTSDVRIVEYI